MATFHERMNYAMQLRGINQTELAKLSGVNRSSICVYLKGEYIPKQKAINALAISLNVSEAWLMGYDAPMERIYNKNDEVPEVEPQRLTKEQEKFIELVKLMDDSQIRKLRQISSLLSDD